MNGEAHPRNPPLEFLLDTIRRFLAGKPPQLDAAINWESVLHFADAHTVTPILFQALRESPIPATVAGQLRARFENSVYQSLAQSAELARLAGIFEERGIAFVALKGPMLSQYLYGTLSTRTSGDIDVLVKRENVPQIRNILGSLGYRLRSTLHWHAESACTRSRDEELSFESPSGVSIDVHWRLMPRYSASVFDRLTGWESLRTVPLAGREIQTLAPESLLLFLCAHGAKHMFERIGWICDVAQFLYVSPKLDWNWMLDHSRSTRSLQQLSLGVQLAVELLGAPASPLEPNREVKSLVQTVRDRLMSGALPPAEAIEANRYMLRLLETRPHRWRYLAGLYLTPSEAEFRALKLPPALFWLYYPYRPLRLLWKYRRS